jgi:amino acid transporter
VVAVVDRRAVIVLVAGYYGIRTSARLGTILVFLAVVNSTIANANAGVNISSRISFAMGRIHAFPAALARVHRTHRSPVLAIVLSFAATIAVTLGVTEVGLVHLNEPTATAETTTTSGS